jgi:DNA-binding PadR family transcriptional regulator
MGLCRHSYLILGILRAADAIDDIHGLTVNEIHSFERLSKPNTIHKKVKGLESSGFISEGAKAGRAKTYYLTEKGSGELPEKKERGFIHNEKQ